MKRVVSWKVVQIVCLVGVLVLSTPGLISAGYNPSTVSNHTVEAFGSTNLLGMTVPLKQVETEWHNRADGIQYLVEEVGSTFQILPNEYGYLRWNYLREHLSIALRGLPLTVVDNQLYYTGRGMGDNFEEKQKSLVQEISSMLHESNAQVHIAEKNAFITQLENNNELQVSFFIRWDTLPNSETLSRCKYLLFLVADELHVERIICVPPQTFQNIAYDFIPLVGDKAEDFDGSGFLLSSPNHEVSSEETTFRFSTVPFVLPEETRNPSNKWSLQLIIEDPENLGTEIFSYNVELPNKEIN